MDIKNKTDQVMSLIDDDKRIEFLPSMFGQFFMKLEVITYDLASTLIEDYDKTSGYWEFALTANGRPFIFPTMKEKIAKVSNIFGGLSVEIPVVLAGLTITAQALCICLERDGSKIRSNKERNRLIDLYHDIIKDGYSMAKTFNCSDSFFALVD